MSKALIDAAIAWADANCTGSFTDQAAASRTLHREVNDFRKSGVGDSEALPTMDAVYRFMRSNPKTSSEMMAAAQESEGGEQRGPLWMPITSAPRDGTHILIAFGSDHVSAAAYHRNDDDLHPWKFLDSQGDGLPIFNGARDDEYGPTHWQPLPKFKGE